MAFKLVHFFLPIAEVDFQIILQKTSFRER